MNYSHLPWRPVSGGVLSEQEEAKLGKQKFYYNYKKSHNWLRIKEMVWDGEKFASSICLARLRDF